MDLLIIASIFALTGIVLILLSWITYRHAIAHPDEPDVSLSIEIIALVCLLLSAAIVIYSRTPIPAES